MCILSHLLLSLYLKGSGWTAFRPEGRNRPVGEQQDSGLHPVHTPGHWELSKWNQCKIPQSLTLWPPLSQSLLSFTNGSVPSIPWSTVEQAAFISFCLKFKAFCPQSIRVHSLNRNSSIRSLKNKSIALTGYDCSKKLTLGHFHPERFFSSKLITQIFKLITFQYSFKDWFYF